MTNVETESPMTHVQKLTALLAEVDGHGIYTVELLQKKLSSFCIPVKLGTGWKVTKKFVKEVERSGGWLNIPVGTPIIDGAQVMYALMKHYGVTNPNSYGGRGRQFYSDRDCLMAEAKRRDEAQAAELAKPHVPSPALAEMIASHDFE